MMRKAEERTTQRTTQNTFGILRLKSRSTRDKFLEYNITLMIYHI